MTRIALLWDASALWGLLAGQALDALGVPVRLVKAQDIARHGLSDKVSLLLVPGGPARLRSELLGNAGRRNIRDWTARGGRYLGLCGGAGLALSGNEGLGLCPWQRAGFPDRLRHAVSGHVRAVLASDPLVPDGTEHEVLLPVWWAGRFAEPEASPSSPGVRVLARYAGAGPDLYMADFALADLPETVRGQWERLYGVRLRPEVRPGEPCVVAGAFGKGGYVLSYSHLETPNSPRANAWLALLLEKLSGESVPGRTVPEWHPGCPAQWDDPALLACLAGMDELIRLGLRHGLLFPRTSWLTGWRSEVPGSGLNSLHLALRVLVSRPPVPAAAERWKALAPIFRTRFALFQREATGHLLARRLAETVPEAVPRPMLAEQRAALFGSPMRGGGLYQELMDMLEDVLFLQLQGDS